MDVALIENAEHYIDREQGGGDQDRLVVERLLKDPGRALKAAMDRGRHVELAHLILDRRRRLAQRNVWCEVERDRRGDEEILVIDCERGVAGRETSECGER